MEVISLAQWKRWSEEGKYALLPYVRKIELASEQLLPAFWDLVWEQASSYACLLESGKGGRYSIVGLRPVSVIEGKDGQARILEQRGNGAGWTKVSQMEGSPTKLLRKWMHPWTGPRPEGVPDCIGGVLGFWSYDVVRSLEKLPVSAEDDLGLPEYVFQRFEQLWVADHKENVVYCAVHTHHGANVEPSALEQLFVSAQQRALEMEQQWTGWLSASRTASQIARKQQMHSRMEADQLQIDVESLPGLSTSLSKSEFQEAVQRIQQYIGQGDVFQVNLSMRQSRQIDVSSEVIYEWLRVINPSPYMGLLRTPSFSLVSASPELLVKLDDGKLSTRPIAGTRRRGKTPEEDRAFEEELVSNEKERAEHVMLVDLERNDLGRVAKYGTVKVPELMTVERYSHVMHLASQVEARVADGKDTLDVLAAVFPGGTITGAPKIRTMEIIEELEPTRRGPYTGSMGWIDYSGNMEFNIIIRTITVQDGYCHIQAGAGIVIDSDPEREFYESLSKAKALWKAVQYSEGQGHRHDSSY
ncbi:anthranilate synthase component I family protein [Cohnella abietis]|uniref:Aminodeoxychorismate synthase, component I n=1 Tax=Cohnella abietis TaxID=2507935 RepID=A0A3T1CXX5_9BACL|nr:anthranilate synthase component I family protein [Cohnella abietis]BBI30684.1 aminodeoxychorismate synthase, component I [Cohnella abietis]